MLIALDNNCFSSGFSYFLEFRKWCILGKIFISHSWNESYIINMVYLQERSTGKAFNATIDKEK